MRCNQIVWKIFKDEAVNFNCLKDRIIFYEICGGCKNFTMKEILNDIYEMIVNAEKDGRMEELTDLEYNIFYYETKKFFLENSKRI